MVVSNRNFLFQGSIFRCELFVSGRVHPPKTNGWNLKIPRKSGTINPKSPTFGLHVSFSGVIPYLCHRRWTTALFPPSTVPEVFESQASRDVARSLDKDAGGHRSGGGSWWSFGKPWLSNEKRAPWLVRLYGGFLKWWVSPTTMGFSY